MANRTIENAVSASRFGQRAVHGASFNVTPLTIVTMYRSGSKYESFWNNSGMFDTGEVAPESRVSGGLTKNVKSCACCWDLETVAIMTPIPIPARAARAP